MTYVEVTKATELTASGTLVREVLKNNLTDPITRQNEDYVFDRYPSEIKQNSAWHFPLIVVEDPEIEFTGRQTLDESARESLLSFTLEIYAEVNDTEIAMDAKTLLQDVINALEAGRDTFFTYNLKGFTITNSNKDTVFEDDIELDKRTLEFQFRRFD